MKTIYVLIALAFLNLSAAHADESAKFLIAPGVRVGEINAKSSEAELKKVYGASHVKSQKINLGEGEYETGTVVFPNEPAKRIEIIWSDSKAKTKPSSLILSGDKSNWKTADGISLGTSLKELEKLNGGSFQLAGFGWDYSGTVMGWQNGKLEALNQSGNILLRLGVTKKSAASSEEEASVSGERNFPSNNPVMQKINPAVYQMIIQFSPRPKVTD